MRDSRFNTNISGTAGEGRSQGWSVNGKLHTGSENDRVSLQANFAEAFTHTIQFSINPIPGQPESNVPIQAEAKIQWNLEGNFVTRRVTVSNGTSITGVAFGATVTVNDATRKSDVTPNGAEYAVGIQISKGTRASSATPPTLVLVPNVQQTLLGGGLPSTVDIPIPQNVGIVSVNVTAVAIDKITGLPIPIPEGYVSVTQKNLAVILKTYDPRTFQWVPVGPGATDLVISNYFPLATDQVFFSVTFGIDG